LHQGFWLCGVTAAEVNGSQILPLYEKLFSVEAKDFTSEKAEVPAAVDLIGAPPGGVGSGPWTAAAIGRICWNPCWIGARALSSAPRASAR
jgi:hypothetical protein